MIKYLLKKKLEKEVVENGKKVAIYTGVASIGVGAYLVYRIMKKSKKEYENIKYLDDIEIDNENDIEEVDENELEEKILEFNSRRITCENCPHVSQEDLMRYVDKVKDAKKEVKLDTDSYREEEYENYEYHDGNLINKE